jgi:hypothetical protein
MTKGPWSGDRGIATTSGAAVPTLGPGQELTNVWWSGGAARRSGGSDQQHRHADDLTVSLTYEDDHGRKYGPDELLLRVGIWRPSMVVVATNSTLGCMRRFAEASVKQAEHAQIVARYASRLDDRLDAQQQEGQMTCRCPARCWGP